MADRMLLITWGPAVRGREERALEVFNEALGLLGRMQQDGRLESFDVALMRPNTHMSGCMLIKGTGAQIDALQDDSDFLRNTTDAEMIVENLHHCEGFTGDGVARMIEMFRESAAKVPQMA
jgi:hypothetical protein